MDIRIITATILGGVLGFYVMHRVEIGSKIKKLTEVLGNIGSLHSSIKNFLGFSPFSQIQSKY